MLSNLRKRTHRRTKSDTSKLEPILKQGTLLKKGAGTSTFGRKSWKSRWFVLRPSSLSYYRFQGGKLLKQIPLKSILSVSFTQVEITSEHLYCNIETESRTFMIAEKDYAYIRDWMDAIEVALQRVDDNSHGKMHTTNSDTTLSSRYSKTQPIVSNSNSKVKVPSLSHTAMGKLTSSATEPKLSHTKTVSHKIAIAQRNKSDNSNNGNITPERKARSKTAATDLRGRLSKSFSSPKIALFDCINQAEFTKDFEVSDILCSPHHNTSTLSSSPKSADGSDIELNLQFETPNNVPPLLPESLRRSFKRRSLIAHQVITSPRINKSSEDCSDTEILIERVTPRNNQLTTHPEVAKYYGRKKKSRSKSTIQIKQSPLINRFNRRASVGVGLKNPSSSTPLKAVRRSDSAPKFERKMNYRRKTSTFNLYESQERLATLVSSCESITNQSPTGLLASQFSIEAFAVSDDDNGDDDDDRDEVDEIDSAENKAVVMKKGSGSKIRCSQFSLEALNENKIEKEKEKQRRATEKAALLEHYKSKNININVNKNKNNNNNNNSKKNYEDVSPLSSPLVRRHARPNVELCSSLESVDPDLAIIDPNATNFNLDSNACKSTPQNVKNNENTKSSFSILPSF